MSCSRRSGHSQLRSQFSRLPGHRGCCAPSEQRCRGRADAPDATLSARWLPLTSTRRRGRRFSSTSRRRAAIAPPDGATERALSDARRRPLEQLLGPRAARRPAVARGRRGCARPALAAPLRACGAERQPRHAAARGGARLRFPRERERAAGQRPGVRRRIRLGGRCCANSSRARASHARKLANGSATRAAVADARRPGRPAHHRQGFRACNACRQTARALRRACAPPSSNWRFASVAVRA